MLQKQINVCLIRQIAIDAKHRIPIDIDGKTGEQIGIKQPSQRKESGEGDRMYDRKETEKRMMRPGDCVFVLKTRGRQVFRAETTRKTASDRYGKRGLLYDAGRHCR